MKELNIIAAVGLNGVIGDSATNSIPWDLPTDLQYFKSKTKYHSVIMGSKTFMSMGRPLPNRRNVVITRDPKGWSEFIEKNVDCCYSTFEEAALFERSGSFVIGGERIYSDALRVGATNLFITIVKLNAKGDVKFPIAGERFLEDKVITDNDQVYVCTSRSTWLKENDIEFQFTEFRLDA